MPVFRTLGENLQWSGESYPVGGREMSVFRPRGETRQLAGNDFKSLWCGYAVFHMKAVQHRMFIVHQ